MAQQQQKKSGADRKKKVWIVAGVLAAVWTLRGGATAPAPVQQQSPPAWQAGP